MHATSGVSDFLIGVRGTEVLVLVHPSELIWIEEAGMGADLAHGYMYNADQRHTLCQAGGQDPILGEAAHTKYVIEGENPLIWQTMSRLAQNIQ